jgi:hypothetical protein
MNEFAKNFFLRGRDKYFTTRFFMPNPSFALFFHREREREERKANSSYLLLKPIA